MFQQFLLAPPKKSLQYWMLRHEMTNTRSGSLPFISRRTKPPSACKSVLQTLLITQLKSDVPARSEVIGENRAVAENSIKRLKNFGCDANQRAKLDRVVVYVRKQVEFDLGDHF